MQPNPLVADTDGDGLVDGDEVNKYKTDPMKPDSDSDGLNDGIEVNTTKTDPLKADTDDDGVDDKTEVGSSPATPIDTDLDSIINAKDTDDDNDGILSRYETYNSTTTPADDDTDTDGKPNYLDADDDGDGILSKDESNDPNKDGNPSDAIDTDGDSIPDYLDASNALKIQVKMLLQGAYDSKTGLMTDSLRTKNLIPSNQPYSNAGIFKYAGREVATASLFSISSSNAPVDWVLVELRDAMTPSTIVARFAGLLQRDGDVMEVTKGDITLPMEGIKQGKYYVAVHHRNHLGIMTATPVELNSTTPTLIDFTKTSTVTTYGADARYNPYGTATALLWAGNANIDTRIIANGPYNDTSVVMSDVLSDSNNTLGSTNYQLHGYYATDINLDGVVIFAGPGNDVNTILGNVYLHPANTTYSANYIITRQIPN